MPAYEKLPSGKHSYVVRLPNGKRKRFTDNLKRVALAQAVEFERSVRNGQTPHMLDRKVTVESWAARWQAARNVEPATAAKDASQIRTHVLPHWGAWPLQSIGRLDVQAWVKAMTHGGAGAATVVGSYHRLAAMLNDAVLEGLLPASPCREIDLPKVTKPAPRWLTRHEYDQIQLALSLTPQGELWQAFVGLGCFSGLRPGELAGLDVEHLDLERGLVRVQQVMTRHGLRGYGKSTSASRSVPFPPEVAALLWRVMGDRGQGPVFLWKDGQRVDDRDWLRQVWRPALEAAGVEYERPYVMRHSCASWLVQAGVPDYEIAQMLGHSSTRIVSTYAHLAPDRHDRVRAAWSFDPQVPHGATEKSPHPAG